MTPVFNIDEIFALAEEIERNGAKFYRKALLSFNDGKIKKILEDLAEMEDRHESFFIDLRKQIREEERRAESFDPYGDAERYLRAIAGGYIFKKDKDPSTLLTGKEDKSEIITIAIGLEKDSIAFYTGIREAVPEDLGKGRIAEIIAEEMRHVIILGEMRDK